MRMTKQQPFLEAQNFHHKLQILLKAIIGCKTSSDTRRSHDYFQCDQHAYHHIAAFNGVKEPQQMAVYIGISCYIQVSCHQNC